MSEAGSGAPPGGRDGEPGRGSPSPSADVIGLEIDTGRGVLRAGLRVPPKPMRLPELALSFMGFSGKLTDLAVAEVTREGKEISCRKGCGACCRQPVPLSPPEAWLIADLVASLPEPRRTATRAAFAAADRVFTNNGIKASLLGAIDTLDQMKNSALDYYRAGIPCPFLVDEACSIHPYRPSICREYLVTSPPGFCEIPGSGPVVRVPVGVRLSEALTNLTSTLLGRPPEVVPLVFALEWAEAHREDGERTWDGRSLIAQLAALLSRR